MPVNMYTYTHTYIYHTQYDCMSTTLQAATRTAEMWRTCRAVEFILMLLFSMLFLCECMPAISLAPAGIWSKHFLANVPWDAALRSFCAHMPDTQHL